jgi:hypothetical protein
MRKIIVIKLISIAFLWSVCIDTTAQSFLGLSINYGDRLMYTPDYPSLLLNPRSFSPTLVYSFQKKFHSDFAVIFGGQVGISGYQLIPVSYDTLSASTSHDRYPFVDYGIFVGKLELTPGKVFYIKKRELFVGIGGGLSYYKGFPYTTMGVSTVYPGGSAQLFSSYVEFPSSGTLCGFVKVYLKMQISNRFDLAFQYSSHWKSILEGEYEFYHTKEPASGSIKLVPRGISLIMLYRFKNRSN